MARKNKAAEAAITTLLRDSNDEELLAYCAVRLRTGWHAVVNANL